MQLKKQESQILPRTAEEYKNYKSNKRKTGDKLDQEDFLMLLIQQMKNQDPLNPMDNAEFTQQTTSFSQLEQMINMNKKLETMLENVTKGEGNKQGLLDGASYVGKQVEYDTNMLTVSESGTSPFSFYSKGSARNVDVEIYNKQGGLVGKLKIDEISEGQNEIPWNGTLLDGAKLAEGTYSYKVIAKDSLGNDVAIGSYGKGIVTGVKIVQNALIFEVDNGRGNVPYDAIYAVRSPEASSKK